MLSNNFDNNLDQLMHNDETDGGKGIWSENGNIQFAEEIPLNPIKENNMKNIIETKRKGKRTPKKENLRASQLKELQKN